jgi:hypothetical protein
VRPVFPRTARRIAKQQTHCRQQQAGDTGDEERHTPAVVLVDQSAHHVAQAEPTGMAQKKMAITRPRCRAGK